MAEAYPRGACLIIGIKPFCRSIRHRVAEWRLIRREVRHPAVNACLALVGAESGIGIERIRFLGRGGSALLFRGVRARLDDVAIKIPRYHGLEPADAELALRREGDVLAAARVACIPRLLWRPLDGHLFVRELVEGRSVDALVKHHGVTARERLKLVAALLDLARALFPAVHASDLGNFVVRDLKPRNLVREMSFGFLKQVDLGGVRREGEDAATKDGVVRLGTGKWLFWAPEQLCRDSVVDRRADYFALGATAFFALTGEAPYANRSEDVHEYQRHYPEVATRLRRVASTTGMHRSATTFLVACLNPSRDDRPCAMESCHV